MRREDNFKKLLDSKKIIIPIIQRDYAQGRNTEKAMSVRSRLIDEWVDIINNTDLQMDFNYLYGYEDGMDGNKVYYPVDGQQRLTSLYLMHWFLACSMESFDAISKWYFDYKTRNSASEFFDLLRSEEKSKELFKLLRDKTQADDANFTKKLEEIKNKSWFKLKWNNDPTIISCLNFLCLLADRLSTVDQQKLKVFWERLNDSEKSAVYFTYISEESKNAISDAAKIYTRMNARGKKLTEFENLKAMFDEIEMKRMDAGTLSYCDPERKETSVSWSYDNRYINCIYREYNGGNDNLPEVTEKINQESLRWFRLIYYVYQLMVFCENGGEIPTYLSVDNYQKEIYQLSQGKKADSRIDEYLRMTKAVFELLCYTDKLTFPYWTLNARNEKSIQGIAFILFAYHCWDQVANTQELIEKWKSFEESLRDDLNWNSWNVIYSDKDVAKILNAMMKGLKALSVEEYFIQTDFTASKPESPFYNYGQILPDLKCRLIEKKIKSKLIQCDPAFRDMVSKEKIGGDGRPGYLYQLCGLYLWDLGDWSNHSFGMAVKDIKEYFRFVQECVLESKNFVKRDGDFRRVFAYASQYNANQGCLRPGSEINQCNIEHMWSWDYLCWNDQDCDPQGKLPLFKERRLAHLKTMIDLLRSYAQIISDDKDILTMFLSKLRQDFRNGSGYEDCWLRFAVEYNSGYDLLFENLENQNGEILDPSGTPVILKIYLQEKGYTYSDQLEKLAGSQRRCSYPVQVGWQVYDVKTVTCTFQANKDGRSTIFHHSGQNLYLELNYKNKNMFLQYFLGLNIPSPPEKGFWSVESDAVGGKLIRVYVIKKGATSNNKIGVDIYQLTLPKNLIDSANLKLNQWEQNFNSILNWPTNNPGASAYDPWLELWEGRHVLQTQVNGLQYKGERSWRRWIEKDNSIDHYQLGWKWISTQDF